MELTKETIENKIKELERAKENLVAQLNSICGAIQVLNELVKQETVKSNGNLPT